MNRKPLSLWAHKMNFRQIKNIYPRDGDMTLITNLHVTTSHLAVEKKRICHLVWRPPWLTWETQGLPSPPSRPPTSDQWPSPVPSRRPPRGLFLSFSLLRPRWSHPISHGDRRLVHPLTPGSLHASQFPDASLEPLGLYTLHLLFPLPECSNPAPRPSPYHHLLFGALISPWAYSTVPFSVISRLRSKTASSRKSSLTFSIFLWNPRDIGGYFLKVFPNDQYVFQTKTRCEWSVQNKQTSREKKMVNDSGTFWKV